MENNLDNNFIKTTNYTVDTENYTKSSLVKVSGIVSLIIFSLVMLIGAIAHLTQLKNMKGVGQISLCLFFGLSEIPLAIFCFISAYFLITERNRDFNSIFYIEAGLTQCAMLIAFALSSLINAMFLFSGSYIIYFYLYKIPINIVTLIIGTSIYVKIKTRTNLSVPASLLLYGFISQILSYCLYSSFYYVILLEFMYSGPLELEGLTTFHIILGIFVLTISLFVIIYYKDFIFGCGYFGYQIVKILSIDQDNRVYYHTKSILIVDIICLVIGALSILYIVIKFKKQCLGLPSNS